jgi:hypothetical protein
MPSYEWGNLIFAPDDGNWCLFEHNGQATIACGPAAESKPRRLLIFDQDNRQGDLYIADPDPQHFAYPLTYPLDEVLMVRLLARGRGVLLHAFAMVLENVGYLFVGRSGAGKSTLANLWQQEEDVTLLSDDRVIVRKQGEHFIIYGTPWHGDARVLSPKSVPLRNIFVIDHAEQNVAKHLSPPEAVTRLFVRSFPPFGDPEGIAFTLGFLSDLTHVVPSSDLGFVPDESAVEFIRCVC